MNTARYALSFCLLNKKRALHASLYLLSRKYHVFESIVFRWITGVGGGKSAPVTTFIFTSCVP